jgi:hypothetical protein
MRWSIAAELIRDETTAIQPRREIVELEPLCRRPESKLIAFRRSALGWAGVPE